MEEIRTQKGRLIGKMDKFTNTLHIKDGVKTTVFQIPSSGLQISLAMGDGEPEEVNIQPQN